MPKTSKDDLELKKKNEEVVEEVKEVTEAEPVAEEASASKVSKAYATTAVNVRKKANINSDVLGTIFKNENVLVEKTKDPEWFKVTTTGGLKGYCVSDYFVFY